MITNLTEGSIGKKLWLFTLPMLISMIFQQIYNMADSMIVGKFVNNDALAAVGVSYPITMIFIAVAVGTNIGCSVVISQLFGGKKYRDMKTAINTTFIVCAVMSITLTILGLIFCEPLMALINTPENIFADASLYLKIYIAGLSFLYFYNICNGIFTALGDSRTPLYFLIGSSIGNILLDLLFVISFGWGVAGVAWATFIAQGASSILSIITLLKRLKKFETGEKEKLFSGIMFRKISLIGIPSILQQSFISVGNILIQGLINSYGSDVIAGFSATTKLITFAITGFLTLGNGISSFTAQNIGAGKPERVKKGYQAGVVMAFCVAIPFIIIYHFFDRQMVMLFMDSESRLALDTGMEYLGYTAPFLFLIAMKLIADGVLRGSGAMKWFMFATFADLLLRVVLSFLLSSSLQTRGIWISWPIGWVASAVLSNLFYFLGVWKDKRI